MTDFAMPDGMRWCPECNGDGVVSTMDATPDLNEHEQDCTFPGCVEGKGIVPAPHPALLHLRAGVSGPRR